MNSQVLNGPAITDTSLVDLCAFMNAALISNIPILLSAQSAGALVKAMATSAPVQAQEPLALLTLGGIDGDEYGDFDLEVISSKAIEKLQEQLVHGQNSVVLELFAAPVQPVAVPCASSNAEYELHSLRLQVYEQGKRLVDDVLDPEDIEEIGARLCALTQVCTNCHGGGEDGDDADANGEGGWIGRCGKCGGTGINIAAPAAQGDAKDAERYRQLRDGDKDGVLLAFMAGHSRVPADVADSRIDAAIAAGALPVIEKEGA